MRLFKFAALALAVTAFAITGTANAQVPAAPKMKPKVYVAGGLFSITGPAITKDSFKGSFSGMLGVGLPFSSIELVGKIHYHKFSSKDSFLLLSVDPKFRAWTYGVDAKYAFVPSPAPARPYIVGGLGAYNFSSGTFSASTSGLYYDLGAGVDIALGPAFSIFGEAKYTSLTGDGNLNMLPILFGVRVM